MERKTIEDLLSLARDVASGKSDQNLDRATEILLYAIRGGCQDPEVLVTAASCLLQGSLAGDPNIKKKAAGLVDRAIALEPDRVPVLEEAIACYELVLNDIPDKLQEIIKLCFKILDLDPNHIESMVTLANLKDRPGATLSLEDSIAMMEWAYEIEPGSTFVAFTLARLYMEAGRFSEAKVLFAHIMSSSPGSKEDIGFQQGLKPSSSPKVQFGKANYHKYSRN
jgi:tetratricopeptide (TPR) repeat protein